MEQSVIISFSLPADLLVGLGHAARAAGRSPAGHLRALLRQAIPAQPVGAAGRGAFRLPAQPAANRPNPREDSHDAVTARVLAILREGREAPAAVAPPAVAISSDDPVLRLVKAVCAEAPAGLMDAMACEAPCGMPPDDGGRALAETGRESIMQECRMTPAPVEAMSAAAHHPLVPGTEDMAGRVAVVGPERASFAHLQHIIRMSPGWLDLQRSLRCEGLVLRLTACGRSLMLHSWPEDHPLFPIDALGLSLEWLCLHFRAPFPGGGGLSLVLRALASESRGPGRAA